MTPKVPSNSKPCASLGLGDPHIPERLPRAGLLQVRDKAEEQRLCSHGLMLW